MSQILDPTPANLEHAAKALAAGRLVALPTETVYGLGGNALIEEAVKKIYAVKGRPPTDPLICHSDCLSKAVKLWDADYDKGAFDLASLIGAAMWPGPLTIVCKAHPDLPLSVTGGSGFVGSRIPRHEVALKLLQLVDFPIAAPSANTFGHVSPTTAKHVYDDLASRDPGLIILDGGSCTVGIESTVIKVTCTDHIEVLRRGKISVSDIQATLRTSYPNTRVQIRDTRSKFTSGDQPMDGPGQLLTHYSPSIPSSLITPSGVHAVGTKATSVQRGSHSYSLAQTVIIDYNGALQSLKGSCLAYRDLSERGSAQEACFEVFEALRWTENVDGAKAVIFPFLSEWPQTEQDAELLAAVEDRLFRAASGITAVVCSA